MTPTDIRAAIASKPAAVAAILIGNLVPVFGVLFLGWDAAQILILYWTENVILGLLTVPRLLAAGRAKPGEAAFLAGFFTVHYGFFCLGHLVFALLLVSDFAGRGGSMLAIFTGVVQQPGFLWAVLALALLNLVIQIREWWAPGKWRTSEPKTEMFKPYGRIFVLHLTVLLGAGVVLGIGAPAAAILILCLMKTALELGLLGFSAFTREPADEADQMGA